MNDSELDEMLRSARPGPALDPNFKSQVWRRIEFSSTETFSFTDWLEKFLTPLTQPVFAAAAVFSMTVLGFGLGAVMRPQAQDYKVAYIQSVSPFASSHGP